MKKFLLFIFCILLSFTSVFAEDLTSHKTEYGKVLSVKNIVENDEDKQLVTTKILTGEFKGEIVDDIENVITGNPYYDIFVKNNDTVVLHIENTKDGNEFYVSDLKRVTGIYLLLGIFVALVLIVGRKKGLMSLVATTIILLLIIMCLTPLLIAGVNPIFATVVLCLISSAIAIYFVGGINYKSTSAVVGTVLSLIAGGVFAYLVIFTSKLTGFASEETMFVYAKYPHLDFVGILASAIIISTLGAIIDIAMSIASTINEVYQLNSSLSKKELFNSGMNVGKDIIGTMTNTLILVYMGGALPIVLLSKDIDVVKFFNLNMVVTEVASALVGSIALVICVPLTALVSAYFVKLNKDEDFEFVEEDSDE